MERPYYGFYHIKNDKDQIISSINLDDISYIIPNELDSNKVTEPSDNFDKIEHPFNIHFKGNTSQYVVVNIKAYKEIVEILSNV